MLKGSLAATLLALQLAVLGAPLLCDREAHRDARGCAEAVAIVPSTLTSDGPGDCLDCARPDCTGMLTCVSVLLALVSEAGSALPPLEGAGPRPDDQGSDPGALTRPLPPPPRT